MENKTSFKKGRKKTGGRKKGTPNKMTLTIREQLKNAIEPFLETMEDTINNIVEPKDKVDAIAKILPFVVPKYQSTTINDDTRRNVTLEEYDDSNYTEENTMVNKYGTMYNTVASLMGGL